MSDIWVYGADDSANKDAFGANHYLNKLVTAGNIIHNFALADRRTDWAASAASAPSSLSQGYTAPLPESVNGRMMNGGADVYILDSLQTDCYGPGAGVSALTTVYTDPELHALRKWLAFSAARDAVSSRYAKIVGVWGTVGDGFSSYEGSWLYSNPGTVAKTAEFFNIHPPKSGCYKDSCWVIGTDYQTESTRDAQISVNGAPQRYVTAVGWSDYSYKTAGPLTIARCDRLDNVPHAATIKINGLLGTVQTNVSAVVIPSSNPKPTVVFGPHATNSGFLTAPESTQFNTNRTAYSALAQAVVAEFCHAKYISADSIGINPTTDTSDGFHLNANGHAKRLAALAQYVPVPGASVSSKCRTCSVSADDRRCVVSCV